MTKIIKRKTRKLLGRFFSKMGQKTKAGCIEWMGCKRSYHGYGAIIYNRKTLMAHVLSYKLFN